MSQITDNTAVSGLQQLGFSEVEARLYTRLAAEDRALTGYQCAKVAGVPRPNAYPALQRLVRRGAMVEVPEGSTFRYRAVPFEELRRSLKQSLDVVLEEVAESLSSASGKPRIAVTRGEAALRQQGYLLLSQAAVRVDVGASVGSLALLVGALQEVEGRAVPVTYYCFDGCPAPGCGICVNPVALRPGPLEMHGWLTLLVDDERVLMATDVRGDPEVLVTDLPPLTAALATLFERRVPFPR